MTTETNVRLSHEDALVTLTLDRPPLNVLDIATISELSRAIAQAAALNPAVLLIKGAGKTFSAGADVGDHLPDKVAHMLKSFHALANALMAFDGLVIAAVRGAALGGGCELALAADLILAADDASFGQPEIKLGVFPPVAMVLLPRLCPAKAAAELILTGEAIPAERAFQLGIINRVYPAAEFEAETAAYLKRILRLSRSSLKITKETLRKLHPADFAALLARAEDAYLKELMSTKDAEEGCRSFIEKRRPVWSHR